MLSFPPNFLWGAATAAHQVEGQNFNCDWWDWEQLSVRIKHNHTSRVACDWWEGERWREDFDRAQELGHNAHRMSVEWSRLEPKPGEWDDNAAATYRAMLQGLRERGIEPFVTLVHYTQPRWFMEQRGWLNDAAPEIFERFVVRALETFGDLCHFWITLNEPNLYMLLNYVWKSRPPGAGSITQGLHVGRNLILAHYRAYAAIHRAQADAQVSLAHQWRWIAPANPKSPFDRFAAWQANYLTNEMFVRALTTGKMPLPLGRGETIADGKMPLDFFALNYYFENRIAFDLTRPGSVFARQLPSHWMEGTPFASFDEAGDLAPSSFYALLKMLARFKLPIYITENGTFDIGTENQSPYLVTHLAAMHRALQAGADVRGYFWWTLVDNFEWDQGYWLRFGLYHLDVDRQTRTKRPVADVYAAIARANGISDELMEQYGREK